MKKLIALTLLLPLIVGCSLFKDSNETKTPLPLKQVSEIETGNWKMITNTKYGYRILTPPGAQTESSQYASTPDKAYWVQSSTNEYGLVISVVAFDTEFTTKPETLEAIKLGLKGFANKVWENNLGKEGDLSNVTEISFAGKKAYKIASTFSLGVPSGSGGGIMREEHTYIFVENNGMIFEIKYPSANKEAISAKESFEFL